ncbi:hypothetical protein NW762_014520 [Fusarium torreyae]|uniref:Uncharacterized protein n=1 Tax=Fusarium torreyae TaxID=1237075 RepID=A0A9W8RMN7_9HYPO|nr:hypothetical protein NW762_014520 [Fusarium torreyae]
MLPLYTDSASLSGQALHAQVSERLRSQLMRLDWAVIKSPSQGLVSVNVSDSSQAKLSQASPPLFDAPVYRLGLILDPSNLRSASVELPNSYSPLLKVILEETSSFQGSESTIYQAEFGSEKSIFSKKALDDADTAYPGIKYPLVTFNRTAIWIGSFHSADTETTESVTATERWGPLVPFSQSSTAFPQLDVKDNNYNLTLIGMACRLKRWTGRADVKVNGSDWKVIEDTLVNQKIVPQHDLPMLSLVSALDVFESGSIGAAPGLGGHLLRAALDVKNEGSQLLWKLETLADAFLWYESKSRRVLLDNDLANRTENGRMIDSIRLTADVGVALDKKVFEECSTWHGTRLNKCADEARFQYEANTRLNSETGHYSTGIRLREISQSHE